MKHYQPHSPLRFDGVPLRALEPSHGLGSDTATVLRERLGLSEAQIAHLLKAAGGAG